MNEIDRLASEPTGDAALARPPAPLSPPLTRAPRQPTLRFMLSHPAHAMALGFGSGLSPFAPGTVGTLWAWLSFLILQPRLDDGQWALLLVVSLVVGIWACTVTARHMAVADPGSIVWDEIIAFWAVLWLVTPAGFGAQWAAFALFRFFDAAKPGPVAWADALFKLKRGQTIGWRQGFGIVFDDLVAALCALMVIAVWRWL
jgi:phosphatidylglycerophosphatase A